MSGILLTSPILLITAVKKDTKAKMFSNLHVGSRIQFSVNATASGANRGPYAKYLKVENMDTGETAIKSFNEIEERMCTFEWEEQKK